MRGSLCLVIASLAAVVTLTTACDAVSDVLPVKKAIAELPYAGDPPEAPTRSHSST